jgi:hypothetical protein
VPHDPCWSHRLQGYTSMCQVGNSCWLLQHVLSVQLVLTEDHRFPLPTCCRWSR